MEETRGGCTVAEVITDVLIRSCRVEVGLTVDGAVSTAAGTPAWVTAAGEGWYRSVAAVLTARRSYAARNSWIRSLMSEGAGRQEVPGARAAIRARSGLAPGSPAPGSCRGGRQGTLIGGSRRSVSREAAVTRMYQRGRPAPLPSWEGGEGR